MQGTIAGSFSFVVHGDQLSQPKCQPTKKIQYLTCNTELVGEASAFHGSTVVVQE